MKKVTAFLLTLMLILALAGCGASSKDAAEHAPMLDMSTGASAPAEKVETEESFDGVMNDSMSNIISSADSVIYDDPNAKVIRTARMTIQTLEFDKSVDALASLTEKHGGYYETAQVDSGGYYNQHARRSAYYVVRIPKANFVAFRNEVGSVGHLYSFTEDAQNVGEAYYDTEARLETLTTKRERLLALLDKADVMEDIISLENALADVQYEIDMHTSTLRKYDSLIDYSTFTINLDEVFKIEEEPSPKEGFGVRLLANLKEGFSDFGESIQDFTLWFARNLISIVIFAVVVFVVIKVVLVVRKKRRTTSEE